MALGPAGPRGAPNQKLVPKHDEAVCADGLGRVLLLQEAPPRVELIDPKALWARLINQLAIVVEDIHSNTR